MAAANPVDLEQFTPVLKNVYLPFRKKAFPKLTPLLAQIRRAGPKTVRYGGNDLFFDVKLGRRGGFSASARGFFPQSKIAREKQGRLGITRTYAQVTVDGLALRAAQGERESYISLAKKVTEDVMEQWQFEQNRILYGDGRGVRAVVKTVNSTSQFVMHNPYGISGAGPGNLHLEVGDDIALIVAATGATRGKSQITDISLSGDDATITVSPAIAGASVGDLMVTAVPASVDASDSSYGAEPYGIEAITDAAGNFATFEGISDDRWAAYATTSASVDESVLMAFLNVIRSRSGADWRQNPESFLLMTTTGIWQAYGEDLLGLRRFAAPQMKLKGGFLGIQVGNATLLDDPWAPRGRVYGIHVPDLIFVDLMDFGKLGYQDSPRWMPSTTQDIYTATYGAYWNVGALIRNSHGVISGITDTTNYSPVF